MAAVTWLGDEDPNAQVIEQYGHTFVKGEAVTVDAELAKKFEGNPTFSTDKTAKAVEAKEPEPVDPDAGTEKAALKAALAERGVKVQGNPSVDTLRAKLAEATK